MAKSRADIWMPLYIGDYLADTGHLTTEQHGAYLLLMMHYWRKGPLPNDDRILAQITRLSADAWSIAQALLRSFFVLAEDGLLHQKRMDEELERWSAKKLSAKEKSSKAAETRWRKHAPSIPPSIASSNHQAMLGSCPLPLPNKNPLPPLKKMPPPGEIPAEVIAKEVLATLSVSGRELYAVLCDICRGELAHGRDPTELLANLVASGRRYTACRSKLFLGKLERFYGDGIWRQPEKQWPWKESPPAPTSHQRFIPAEEL